MARENAREQLVRFLDQRVFNEVLGAKDERPGEGETQMLVDAKRRAEADKKRFHHDYPTAEELVKNYLYDLSSDTGKQKSRDLEALGLPSLSGIRYDFLRLCDDLGIRH
jgi:hypothetical protein